MREVFIDGKQVDIDSQSVAGYIFTSPIFRDITKILANRTTTYKLPATEHNKAVFGLANQPDVQTKYPYQLHDLEEYRDSMLFIKGKCTLLKMSDDGIELSVIWGNTINMLQLKDLKLRELKNPTYYEDLWWTVNPLSPYYAVQWGNGAEALMEYNAWSAGDWRRNFGYIVVDYGKGVAGLDGNDKWEYMRPAINVRGVLSLIESSTGVEFKYPERFNEVFEKKWIPLFDLNADEQTWNDFRAAPQCLGLEEGIGGHYFPLTNVDSSSLTQIKDKHGIVKKEAISWSGENFKIRSKAELIIKDLTPRLGDDGKPLKAVFEWVKVAYFGLVSYFSALDTPPVYSLKAEISADGYYHFEVPNHVYAQDTKGDVYLMHRVSYYTDKGERIKFNSPSVSMYGIVVRVEEKEVKYIDKYKSNYLSAIPNLPDITVVDFLKSLMHMYGLFTYYDYRLPSSTIEFLSIDDIYTKYKANAYDWSNRLVNNGKGKMSLTYNYGSYAQVNHLKYADEKTVPIDANGTILVDDNTLETQKDLFTLPFAPSLDKEVKESETQVYAYIDLFNDKGEQNSIKERVLIGEQYKITKEGQIAKVYTSGRFDQKSHFEGTEGLIAKYYQAYSKILKQPVAVEFSVFMDEAELHLYRETIPVLIDGVYYAVLELTATPVENSKSLCKCKAIKMPYLEIDDN